MAKETPEQKFAKIFFASTHGGPETEGVRANAERKVNEWLKRHGRVRSDIPAILLQAARDDEAQKPPAPPPPDPRDSGVHPYDDPQFTPIGVVESFLGKYLTMQSHDRVILAAWICFTHVYERFATAPRVALVSEGPDSGKTTAKNVARRLVRRPNPETGGTAAAITEFIDEGPCTVLIDELDSIDKESLKRLQLIWNDGHERDAMRSLMVRGRRKLVKLHAPMLAAGVGSFLAPTQKSRTFIIEMAPYAEDAIPEREYTTEQTFEDFDTVYAYVHRWARDVKLDPKPNLSDLLRRHRDNARGLVSVADACGPEWGQRVREAIRSLFEKEQAESPRVAICRHALVIYDTLEIDRIKSRRVNRELKLLDLPDADWTRYRGASGLDYAHPITLNEQARLLATVGITSSMIRFPDGPARGYYRGQFEEALHRGKSGPARGQLRLIKSDP